MTTALESLDLLERHRAFVVVRGAGAAAMASLVPRLADGGLRIAEVSLSTPDGLDVLKAAIAAAQEDGRITIGAGTVRTLAQAEAVVDAGAQFLVAPGLNTDILAFAAARDLLHLPGVMTPTEVDRALAAGAHAVKLFPAGRLGPGYIRDLLGPFPGLRVSAVGGVHAGNAADFLAAGAFSVGYGGQVLPKEPGPEGDDFVARIREAVQAVSPARPTKESHAH